MEIGQVIGGHYLLQRLTQQGQYATVYQGIDQSFQRLVAVKAVLAAFVPPYKAAIRKTSSFSHPNVVMLYDLVSEAEQLYLIEEYVEGDDFAKLLQAQLQPYDVVEYGRQICAALLYASSPGRRVCHGDLTPTAILRDRRGVIRVNNFALPSDRQYFNAWNTVSGEDSPLADQDLPYGVISPGRQADDTRAVGLLLYQLLASRPPHATEVDPPLDGRLRFIRNVPAELCELVARTIIRSHPQHINTLEALDASLYTLTETLESAAPLLANRESQVEEVRPRQFSPSGFPVGIASHSAPSGYPSASYQKDPAIKLASMEPIAPAAPTIADPSLLAVTSRQTQRQGQDQPYSPLNPEASSARSPLLLWLVIGLIAFILFFIVGFFLGSALLHL